MHPVISIIIPTYNRAHLLGETLESIVAQTFTHWECIVIDDGSTDHTRELLDFYTSVNPRIKYFKRPENKVKGANSCRNFGFELSEGAYINWFDDDDLMHPEKLELQLRSLENSTFHFSVCQSLVFKNSIKNILGLRNQFLSSDNVFNDYLTMKIGWMTPSALWKKEFLRQQLNLFDEELKAAQEWEFHCRILNKFPHYAKLEHPLVYIRNHEQSVTYNQDKKNRYWHYVFARLKIYKNINLILDNDSDQYLKKYLLTSFKQMIVENNYYVISAYRLFILPEKQMSYIAKVNAALAIFSFKLINKGNLVLQKIKYK
ncbi:MAG: glycosyltransferase family 2 protein [Gillisia sp.]